MNDSVTVSEEQLRQVVATFWESFPPFWQGVRAHIRRITAEQFGISVEQFHILRHIRRGHSSVSELAEAKQISRAAVSQAMNALVEKELVSRRRNPHDRRHVELTLTESGERLLDTVFEDTRQWMMQLLSPLNAEELEALRQGLDSLRKIEAG